MVTSCRKEKPLAFAEAFPSSSITVAMEAWRWSDLGAEDETEQGGTGHERDLWSDVEKEKTCSSWVFMYACMYGCLFWLHTVIYFHQYKKNN